MASSYTRGGFVGYQGHIFLRNCCETLAQFDQGSGKVTIPGTVKKCGYGTGEQFIGGHGAGLMTGLDLRGLSQP